MKKQELVVACDIEADGPIPGYEQWSMLSLGMAVVDRPDLTFYTEIRPISPYFQTEAMEVNGLDRDRLLAEAPGAYEAMESAKRWLESLPGKPVFLAAPAVWDGMFVHWYFVQFCGKNPFGTTGSGIDLRSFWMGRKDVPSWSETGKRNIVKAVGGTKNKHTHNALDDAMALAELFSKVRSA